MTNTLPPLAATLRPGMPILGIAVGEGDETRVRGTITRVIAPYIEVNGSAYRADSMTWRVFDPDFDPAADLSEGD